MPRSRWERLATLKACSVWLLGAMALTGCLGKGVPVVVTQPPPVSVPAAVCGDGGPGTADCVVAAAREVDITPPPGLPIYGYSTNGTSAVPGTWLRLKARILTIQSGTHLVVLIQADLGASSSIVHRTLAAALASSGVTPANLMFAATHTHGGPGGFHGERFYNAAVSARPGYAFEYVGFIVERMRAEVAEALADMQPARLGVATAQVGVQAVHNRSIEAWRKNYLDRGIVPRDEDAVDRTLTLLRVDRRVRPCEADACYAPLASWSVFGVHATGMPATYPLYHGDVHGIAARILSGWVHQTYRRSALQPFVAATATGPEGDVGPGYGPTLARGRNFTIRVATAEARAAYEAFRSLDGRLRRTTPIRYAYAEDSVPNADTSLGKVCDQPRLGAAQLAGSEESRGPVPFFDIAEGLPDLNEGCQGTKPDFPILQTLIYGGGGNAFPDVLPFQMVAFGAADDADGLVLAGVPGEPTTEVGRSIVKAVQDNLRAHQVRPVPKVAVVAMANAYVGYVTMPGEYLAQHYEGGATIYGAFEGQFTVEHLGELAGSIAKGAPTRRYSRQREFQTGARKGLWPSPQGPCVQAAWQLDGLQREEEAEGGVPLALPFAVVHWQGASEHEACAPPRVWAECQDASGTFLKVADDEGIDFEIWRGVLHTWHARWVTRGEPDETCRLVVAHRGEKVLHSAHFRLDGTLLGARP